MLSTGRSFLTPKPVQAIQHDQETLTLLGALQGEASEPRVMIGMRRDRSGGYTAKVNGAPVRGVSEMAVQLPLQLFTPDTLGLVAQGPEQRRTYLDFGLFHSQPAYKQAMQTYKSYLKQRNAWLRAPAPKGRDECAAWDVGLAQQGEHISAMREAYLQSLQPHFVATTDALLGELKVDLQLQRGWNRQLGLAESLHAGWVSDQALGYTQSGPHRADLVFTIDGRKAKEVMSRGQQKMLACALKFAQERLFKQESGGRNSLLLIDDLVSELDDQSLGAVLAEIVHLDGQALLTALNQEVCNKMQALVAAQEAQKDFWQARFSLKSGQIQPQCFT